MTSARLHTLSVGTAGPRIAFLHGLFGQGRNWSQVAKAVAGPEGREARCLLVDLPDHGRSPWSEAISYPAYAAAVAATLRAHGDGPDEPWILVGHSMGGKTAMVLALTEPDLLDRLVVVDIAPKHYGDLHRFGGYIAEMRRLPLAEITSRADAEERFEEDDPGVKAFLLQNLRRGKKGWHWQANIALIADDAARGGGSTIADFPFEPEDVTPYERPVLWLNGGDSEYVHDEDVPRMQAFFPLVRQVTVKGAGHWVHTEAPEVTVEALRRVVAAAAGG